MNKEATFGTTKAIKSVAHTRRDGISSNENGAFSKLDYKKSQTSLKSNKNSGIQYVLPLGNGWVVKGAETAVFTAITDSKSEAISMARIIAKNNHLELIVHGKDGSIEVRENYSDTQ